MAEGRSSSSVDGDLFCQKTKLEMRTWRRSPRRKRPRQSLPEESLRKGGNAFEEDEVREVREDFALSRSSEDFWPPYPAAIDPVPQPTVALRDFSVIMPHLLREELDLNAIPNQIKVALAFLQSIRPQDYVRDEDVAHLQPLLPPQCDRLKSKQTLVLDLDETLVHCHPSKLDGPDPPLKLRIETCPPLNAHVYVRPAARKLLDWAKDAYEVVIFTASASIYADQVLDWLDPNGNIISHRLYRQHCTEIAGGHFKDMRRLGRSLDGVVLVDNSPLAAGMCPDNSILCSSWFGDDYEDAELENLIDVLWTLQLQPSIPAFLRERFGFDAFLQRQRKKQQRVSATVSGTMTGTMSGGHHSFQHSAAGAFSGHNPGFAMLNGIVQSWLGRQM